MKHQLTRCALVAVIALSGCSDERTKRSRLLPGADPDRGKTALTSYGCVSCHTIPGVPGSNSLVAPPLIGISQRSYLPECSKIRRLICDHGSNIRARSTRTPQCLSKV